VVGRVSGGLLLERRHARRRDECRLDPPATIPNINAALDLPIVNQSPVAVSDTYTTTRNAGADGCGAGRAGQRHRCGRRYLTATLASNVLTGMLNLRPNGSFIYTPTLNYTGQVTFTYRATDSLALSNPALVTITVQPSITTANLFIRKTSLRERRASRILSWSPMPGRTRPTARRFPTLCRRGSPVLPGIAWQPTEQAATPAAA